MEGAELPLTTNQAAFADYLASRWKISSPTLADSGAIRTRLKRANSYSSTDFWHEYPITSHRAWRTWKNGNPSGTLAQRAEFDLRRTARWWCGSLREAECHYSWAKSKFGDFPTLAGRLRQAMKNGDVSSAGIACDAIFGWGGVARRKNDLSLCWVKSATRKKTLIDSLQMAKRLLHPSCNSNLSTFCKTGLLMNSAMTKVYAATDPVNIAIYDGRVGAALGLLARRFLESEKIKSVPSDLAFLWGPSRGRSGPVRDPSSKSLNFDSIYAHGIGNLERAKTARMTNAILRAMRARLKNRCLVVPLEKIERALFMIGYDVNI
jgi:hypothetical protein